MREPRLHQGDEDHHLHCVCPLSAAGSLVQYYLTLRPCGTSLKTTNSKCILMRKQELRQFKGFVWGQRLIKGQQLSTGFEALCALPSPLCNQFAPISHNGRDDSFWQKWYSIVKHIFFYSVSFILCHSLIPWFNIYLILVMESNC